MWRCVSAESARELASNLTFMCECVCGCLLNPAEKIVNEHKDLKITESSLNGLRLYCIALQTMAVLRIRFHKVQLLLRP